MGVANATLERVKVARREHTEMLVAAGTSDGMALRSTQRIEAISDWNVSPSIPLFLDKGARNSLG